MPRVAAVQGSAAAANGARRGSDPMTRGNEPGNARMLEDIRVETRLIRHLTGRSALDPRVMQAMAQVPRDAFVPDELKSSAFDNGPLPIGQGQTISQPFIVALMTDIVAPRRHHRVLEIGTGSGYQAAVLSLLCDTVFSVERVAKLAGEASERLSALGYRNVVTRAGNGYLGWPEHAPYDGILVTAAAPYVPPALVEQLKPGGRMVIPLGEPQGLQRLLRIDKDANGRVSQHPVLDVAFVPMVDATSDA
jgi:protein-L-isoaspartate(D-aspartate) O-methyltransferase